MKQILLKIVAVMVILVLFWRSSSDVVWGPEPNAVIKANEMTELSVELVYQGRKPNGVSSVQSMAITDDYFVIAGRPYGSREQGGETNNKLIIVDRAELCDVTDKVVGIDTTFELGHANGMTYNAMLNELVIVGIRDDDGGCTYAASINVDNFQDYKTMKMSHPGNGIAYNYDMNKYIVRDDDMLCVFDADFNAVPQSQIVMQNLTKQDIAYCDNHAYLMNWAHDRREARVVGVLKNQNVIYRVNLDDYAMDAYVIREPRLEIESMDFATNGDAYVLFNGIGSRYGYYYIYKIKAGSI